MKNASYLLEMMSIYRNIPDDKKSDFMTRFNAQARNPVVIFGFSAFLRYFGIDRFLLGQVVLGILKLITFGGFGFWVLIDLFLIAGTTREKTSKSLARSQRIMGSWPTGQWGMEPLLIQDHSPKHWQCVLVIKPKGDDTSLEPIGQWPFSYLAVRE